MNNTKLLQDYFFKYINAKTSVEKNSIIKELHSKLPMDAYNINLLKGIIDELGNNASISFINNVFKISDDQIDFDLLEQISSSLANKTVKMPKIETKNFIVHKYDDLEKIVSPEELIIQDNLLIVNDDKKMFIDNYNEASIIPNYLISKLFGINNGNLYIGENDYARYIISDYNIKNEKGKICKEDSLCSTLEVQYYIDAILDKQKTKNNLLTIILIDVLTSQNYRNSDYLGILPSDLSQNEYYVLDGKTIKKSILIDSLYRNYYEELKSIINDISQNYLEIENLIVDSMNIDNGDLEKYLYMLKENIEYIYKKDNTEKALSNILEDEQYTFEDDYEFKNNLNKIRIIQGLESKVRVRNEAGYISIISLVSGVILFGICIAYLMIK